MRTVQVPESLKDCVALALSEERETLGLNQGEMSLALDVAQSSLSRIERGQMTLDFVQWLALPEPSRSRLLEAVERHRSEWLGRVQYRRPSEKSEVESPMFWSDEDRCWIAGREGRGVARLLGFVVRPASSFRGTVLLRAEAGGSRADLACPIQIHGGSAPVRFDLVRSPEWRRPPDEVRLYALSGDRYSVSCVAHE